MSEGLWPSLADCKAHNAAGYPELAWIAVVSAAHELACDAELEPELIADLVFARDDEDLPDDVRGRAHEVLVIALELN